MTPPSRPSPFDPVRRRLLVAGLASAFLPACARQGGDGHRPAALDFDAGTLCVLDGLRLIDHPGPKAQIFRRGVAQPDFYCDTVELFHTFFAAARHGRPLTALYVQDMGQADWDAPRGHWIEATAAHYVQGSERFGPMGPTLVSFAQRAGAETFARIHGGTIFRFADIGPEQAVLDGGALHDTTM